MGYWVLHYEALVLIYHASQSQYHTILCHVHTNNDLLYHIGVNGGSGAAILGFLEGGSLCKRGATLGKLVVVAPTAAERDSLRANVEKILENVIPVIGYG